jgi:RNA polymerase sigma-70 factor, ECF subfamily
MNWFSLRSPLFGGALREISAAPAISAAEIGPAARNGNFWGRAAEPVSEVNDGDLLDRARQGDERAFAQLFDRYQRPIFRYATHMCGRDAGDDVVQETFLAILRGSGRYDPARGGALGYLFGIARHHVLKRLSQDRAGQGCDELDETAPAVQESALERLTRAEAVAAVRTAIRSLPSAYREVVVLCELQELDYAGVAEIVQCPIGTVRSRLHRARAMLAVKLAAMPVGASRRS